MPNPSAPTDAAASGATVGAADDTSALSYEQARDELVQVVNELERGAATLEQSLALWERGEALAARCEEWLIGAKTRLDAARASASGAGAGSGVGAGSGAGAGAGRPAGSKAE